ncbi:hypothetical protein KTR66_15235 [Roseococcus sp. SDR]|uniref:AAA-like domain-containing protein n=1 Tax=Roseococcus sp. SDR TaxID=2835532 RepID=UPI001BCE18D6|nr:AAA-like domain-containing protein [Roseococcus sp. SDR]MBS7791354.1 hypothetical protein [Roseococcus sp. SDR]MBV1846668.1 hypothetical protein [Roseococcus sp. SDR]
MAEVDLKPEDLLPVNVFTPNDYPRLTYVKRAVAPALEDRLQQALLTPKEVISISGPSKSGKSVLIERIVGVDNLITVSGSEISSTASLWDRVLDWMGAPSSRSNSTEVSSMSGKSSILTGTAGVPLVAGGSLAAGTQNSETDKSSTSSTHSRGGLLQVQKEIANSSFCVLIDDFHYIPKELQVEIGRQIKTAAERGIRMIAASVPHRSDDVVRSNSELRGRTQNIDTEFWSEGELLQIAQAGFLALNIEIDDLILRDLARNACGSPQLMQRICLNLCVQLQVKNGYIVKRYVSKHEINLKEVLAVTATSADYKTLVTTMHQGPKTRGVERNKYNFVDGSRGDVYRCILLAIQQDPPVMAFRYDILMERVKAVCIGDSPVGRGVTEACSQLSNFASADRTVEFDTDADVETFYISDPYWLFYLRCSPKLGELAKEHHAAPS